MSDNRQPHPPQMPRRTSRGWRWLAWAVSVVLCLAVFGLYTVPDFMVIVADQVWACF